MDLFANEHVRNYIYEAIRGNTGSHVIYHQNGIDNMGRTNQKNADYILEKLKQIPFNSHFDMMYVGGGHGNPTVGSSNLTTNQLRAITNLLKENKINFDSVILGSCFSAAYSDLYQPLLNQNGVMISNSLECGDNCFQQSLEWMNGKRDEFFLKEDLIASERGFLEARSGIKRMLEAEISREELNKNSDELYEEYKNFITILQARRDEMSDEQIKELLSECPILNKHINTLIIKRINQQTSIQEAADVVLSTLKIRVLQPYPTSLAVSNAGTLTLIDFKQFTEMPPNVSVDYRKDYKTVVQKIKRSGKFNVNEVIDGFDGVSAKKQFNVYLASVTSQTENVKQHDHAPEETNPQVQENPGVPAKEEQGINNPNKNEPKLMQQQEKVRELMNKIDAVLQTLENKIGDVDQHHFPEAAEKSRELLSNLRAARHTYHTNLKKPD